MPWELRALSQLTVKVNNGLIVISTDPPDGAKDIDIYTKFKITFNKPIDQSTLNPWSGTVQFTPPLLGSFTTEWSVDGKTVTITPTNQDEDLQFLTNYSVVVTDFVRDTAGIQLDGDNNKRKFT